VLGEFDPRQLRHMTDLELHWLAGILEGEGSFLAGPPSAPNKPRIALQMCDEDVVARVAALFGIKYQTSNRGVYKTIYVLTFKGFRAVTLMQQLRPLMGRRRQQQIDNAVRGYVPPRQSVRPQPDDVLRLHAQGLSNRAIAKVLKVDRNHINRFFKGL
jgi:hypothetical protein